MMTLSTSTCNIRNNDDVKSDNVRCENVDDSVSTMDGKRMRKAVFRRTIDYNSSVAEYLEEKIWKRKFSLKYSLQPDTMYQHLLTPPMDYRDNPMNCVCAKHVRTSTNKNKCPIYVVCWTPDGRRLITGASSGEFTLWNGLTFNFETILQAHDSHIRTMKWSNNEEWLLSADDAGFVKYWQANMNDVNVFQAQKEAIRGVSFCPSDKKFVTCGNDNSVRIFDFQTYREERVLRGHGSDVRCVSWHPTKALVLSGSKDSQQPLKLWDPKTGTCISTMFVHKSTVTDIGINKNGNWFLTASKDHYIKLFDLRNLKSELQVFRGHKKDVIRVAWHPYHETLFASGSGDGALLYWMVGTDMEVGAVEDAHENVIWSLDWHPMGHILASGSNDFATKFWTRNRPGDVLRDSQSDQGVTGQQGVSGQQGGVMIKSESHHQGPDNEVEPITRLEKEKIETSLDDVDIQKLSSSIEADLERSERLQLIPGLSEGLKVDLDHSSSSLATDDDNEDRECRLKGGSGSASRAIPKQFAQNWTSKKVVSLVVQQSESSQQSSLSASAFVQQPIVTPLTAIQPLCPPMSSSTPQPPQLIQSLLAPLQPQSSIIIATQPNPIVNNSVVPVVTPVVVQARMSMDQPHQQPSPFMGQPYQTTDHQQHIVPISIDDPIRHQLPPFRPPRSMREPFALPPCRVDYRHDNNGPQLPPSFMDNNKFEGVPNKIMLSSFNQQAQNQQNGPVPFRHHQPFQPPNRPSIKPLLPELSNQNSGPMRPPMPPRMPYHHHNRAHSRQQQHHHPHPHQHHQPQMMRMSIPPLMNMQIPTNNSSDLENPFEPQKSTGSSKTFIPLSQNFDDGPRMKRPRLKSWQSLNR